MQWRRRNGLYGRQTLRGNLAYGGGPHEWIDIDGNAAPAKPSTPLMGQIDRRRMEIFPKAAHARIIPSWAGVIENTPDEGPVIDRLSSHDNVVVATMSGVGFGLSPATGHAIRDLIVDGACSFADISSFKLARFLRSSKATGASCRDGRPRWLSMIPGLHCSSRYCYTPVKCSNIIPRRRKKSCHDVCCRTLLSRHSGAVSHS